MSALQSLPKEKHGIYSYQDNLTAFREGFRDGIPIALGYFAVAFSLGIQAGAVGLDALQGFLLSALVNASAGQYAALTVIAALGTYTQMALMSLIANARYMLMSAALSQRFSENTPFYHRFLVAFGITDEIFGISIARPGYINPFYNYGAFAIASPGWANGTACGIIAGDVLPTVIVEALGVALFGMFLAIIIPPCRDNHLIGAIVLISFIASYASTLLPWLRDLSSGTVIIILTVVISGIAAILFPVHNDPEEV